MTMPPDPERETPPSEPPTRSEPPRGPEDDVVTVIKVVLSIGFGVLLLIGLVAGTCGR